MTNYVPIYEYAKAHGMSKQNAYRLVREGRFPEDSVIVEEVTVERIRIQSDVLPSPAKRLKRI